MPITRTIEKPVRLCAWPECQRVAVSYFAHCLEHRAAVVSQAYRRD